MQNKLPSVLLFMFLIIAAGPLNGQEWELEKDKEGIRVFTRKVADYAIKEYRAETVLKTTIEALMNLMKNHEDMKTWFVKCPISTRLKKVSEEEYYVYFLNDAPWPVSDRDNITHIKYELLENGTQLVHLKGIPDYIPEKESIVRLPRMRAKWTFEPLSDGMVKITQQVLADLGGKIPGWLVNFAIVDAPFETICNLKKKLEK